MRSQAECWGAELFQEDVEFVDVKNSPFTVQSSDRKVIFFLKNIQPSYLELIKIEMFILFFR